MFRVRRALVVVFLVFVIAGLVGCRGDDRSLQFEGVWADCFNQPNPPRAYLSIAKLEKNKFLVVFVFFDYPDANFSGMGVLEWNDEFEAEVIHVTDTEGRERIVERVKWLGWKEALDLYLAPVPSEESISFARVEEMSVEGLGFK